MATEQSKIRRDAWYATLPDEDLWAIYEKGRAQNWLEATAWAAETYGVEQPSRSAWYRFLETMRRADASRRIERAAQSAAEAAAMARGAGVEETALIESFKAIAADIALRTGDGEAAERYVRMAMSIADRAQRRQELALKARAQETKDEQLKLAREKFEAAERRLNAAAAVVADGTIGEAEKIAQIKELWGIVE